MEKILEILEDIRPDSDFRNSSDFMRDALLDSLNLMTLVVELEDFFGIKISYADIVRESFVSLDAMKALVKKSGGEI